MTSPATAAVPEPAPTGAAPAELPSGPAAPVARRAASAVALALAGLGVGLVLPYDAWHGSVPVLVWVACLVAVVAIGGDVVAERSGGRVGVPVLAVLAGLGIGAAAAVAEADAATVAACTAGTVTALGVGALVAATTPRRLHGVLRWLLVLVAVPVAYAAVAPGVAAALRAAGVTPEDGALALGWAAALLGSVNVALAVGATRRHQNAPGAGPDRAWSVAAAWALPVAGVNGPVVLAVHVVAEVVGGPIGMLVRGVGSLLRAVAHLP